MPYLVYLFAVLAGLSDLIGGLLSFHPKARQIESRYILGFASGIVVAAALFELIPESDSSQNYLFIGLGFFTFYLIEKGVMLHSCGERECEVHTMSWVSVIGMGADNVIDGVAIGVGFLASPALGLLIALAVIVHEIPQGFATAVIMRNSGFRLSSIMLVLIAESLMYPVGAALSNFIPANLYSIVIAFVAGDFIYIGASDLLTEAHKKFNIKVMAAVLMGAVIFLALEHIV